MINANLVSIPVRHFYLPGTSPHALFQSLEMRLKLKVLFFIFIQDKRFVSSERIPLIDTALFGGQTGVLFSLFFTNVLIDMLRINVFDPGIQGI